MARLMNEKGNDDLMMTMGLGVVGATYTNGSKALFEAAALTSLMDDGYVPISTAASVRAFIEVCRQVRFWARTPADNGDQPPNSS